MRDFFRRLLCGRKGHWLVHVRNIYGDEINYRGGKRSVWECQNCGAIKLRDYLHCEQQGQSSARDGAERSDDAN